MCSLGNENTRLFSSELAIAIIFLKQQVEARNPKHMNFYCFTLTFSQRKYCLLSLVQCYYLVSYLFGLYFISKTLNILNMLLLPDSVLGQTLFIFKDSP